MAIITERFSPLIYPLIEVRGVFFDLLLVLSQFGIGGLNGDEVGHRLRPVLAEKQEDRAEAEAYRGVGNDPTEGVGRRQIDRRAVVADKRLHDLFGTREYAANQFTLMKDLLKIRDEARHETS